LLNEITNGGTCFFRSPPQIEALRKIVIKLLAEARNKPALPRLRFWSAGCSTGEEAYTLAMVLLEETKVTLRGRDFEVVATDLNARFLAKARDGIYTGRTMRNVPVDFAEKYFTKAGSMFRVADSVRQFISFRQLNLSDDAEMLSMRGIDAISCCNALIYFDRESKARAIRNFYNALLPTGYLFLGPSESLSGINEKFRPVHFPGATAYLKSEPLSEYRIDSARSPD
jgi:chemotaxis protein methyltransferase CheR